MAAVPTGARAQIRAVLVDPDGSLEAAMHDALDPWGIALERVEATSPGASMPGSAERGRALAEAHAAEVAIWISEAPDGFAVWVYDARGDRVVARALPQGPPFDALAAAEIALVVKTLVRQGPVAPPPVSREPAGPAPPPAPPRAEWALALGGGARFLATAPDRAEARLGLAVSFFPSSWSGRLGFALEVDAGPGLDVATASLAAHWTEASARLALRARLPVLGWLELGMAAGAGAQLLALDGQLLPSGAPAGDVRLAPIVTGDLLAGARLTETLRLVLQVGVGASLHPPTYRVGERTGLAVEPAHLRTLLSLEIGLR